LQVQIAAAGLKVSWRPMQQVFKPREETAAYKRTFTETADPGFGVVNNDGRLIDLLAPDKLGRLRGDLDARPAPMPSSCRDRAPRFQSSRTATTMRYYFDKTRQPIL
jgi:hypothetical protein